MLPKTDIKKVLMLTLKNIKTAISVVATTFFSLRMLNMPGCYMNKIKNMINVTINLLKILSENRSNSVTNI